MKKNIVIASISLLAALSVNGCLNTEINMEGRSFEELCQLSGGEIGDRADVCKCSESDCIPGIICAKYYKEYVCASSLPSGQCDNFKEQSRCYEGTFVECKESENGQYIWTDPEECKANGNAVSCKDMNSCGVCKNNTTKCEENDDISATYICINGLWGTEPQFCGVGSGCHENSCGQCLSEATKCENDRVYVCVDGVWNGGETCNGTSCMTTIENDSWCGECKDGDIRCNASDGVPAHTEICKDGKWGQILSYCETGFCAYGDKTCGCEYKDGKNIICKNENNKGVLYRCDEKGVFNKLMADDGIPLCEDGVSCLSVVDEENNNWCGECENGEIRCIVSDEEPAHTEICNNGKWGKVVSYCESGTCSSEGKNCGCDYQNGNNITCVNNSSKQAVLYKCNEKGTFQQVTTSENINGCTEGVSCLSLIDSNNNWCGECKNGETRCAEEDGIPAHMEICQDGQWGHVLSYCETGTCSMDGKTCGCAYQDGNNVVCRNDSNDQGKLYKCDETGTFNLVVESDAISNCRNGVSCLAVIDNQNNLCGECKNGEIRCISSDEIPAHTEICKDGKWGQVISYCETGTCSKDAKLCGCDYQDGNNIICKNDIGDQGSLYKCDEKGTFNQVTSEIDCVKGVSCLASVDTNNNWCGECKNGEIRCTSSTNIPAHTEICMDGKWGAIISYCETGTCSTDKKVCGCESENYKCENNLDGYGFKYKCGINGRYDMENSTTCDNASCASESSCGVCVNGTTKCENDMMHICQNGIWGVGMACGDAGCFNEKVCKVCEKGEYKCDGNNLRYNCDELQNSWVPNGGTCAAVGMCTYGETKCICIDESCEVKVCNNQGDWVKSTSCKPGYLCKNYTQCGDCKEGDVQCITDISGIGMLRTCTNGVYVETACANNASCQSNTACGACPNGKFKNISNDINKCVLVPCVNGKWEEAQKKEYAVSCHFDEARQYAEIGVCVNGPLNCISGNYDMQICVNGEIQVQRCNTGNCNANTGVCY